MSNYVFWGRNKKIKKHIINLSSIELDCRALKVDNMELYVSAVVWQIGIGEARNKSIWAVLWSRHFNNIYIGHSLTMYAHRTDYSRGYIVEYLDSNESLANPCHKSWLLIPAQNFWPEGLKGTLYLICMGYFFIGIAIASDIFMNSIEALTSKEREVAKWDKVNNEMIRFNVRIWNETVANLTLMALGSSAPEIMLATIEAVIRLPESGTAKDSLGVFTIIGSAAFNLLIITSVCISSVPGNHVKKIQEFGVFLLTSAWSMWAYIWMLLVVRYISPGVIDPWEAWVTLGYMPLFVFLAYCQDNGWWCTCLKTITVEEDDLEPVVNISLAVSLDSHISFLKFLLVIMHRKYLQPKKWDHSNGISCD